MTRHAPRILATLLAAGLCACPGHKPGAPPPSESLSLPVDSTEEVAAEFGPGLWHEAGGLRMFLPEGWTGRAGPQGSSLLVTFSHGGTGVDVEIWAYARSGSPTARPRPDCTWMFSDSASHRVIPILAPATTGTCSSKDPWGEVVQGWYGMVGEREVHIEVVYPHGRVIEGRKAVEPLLADLAWR